MGRVGQHSQGVGKEPPRGAVPRQSTKPTSHASARHKGQMRAQDGEATDVADDTQRSKAVDRLTCRPPRPATRRGRLLRAQHALPGTRTRRRLPQLPH